MRSYPLQHVAIWLDDDLTEGKVLPQAIDWAFRLSLPLRAVVSSGRLADKMQAWGTACAQRGVPLEVLVWLGDDAVGPQPFLQPHGLCVFEPGQDDRLQRAAGERENPVLVCSHRDVPMTRALVLNDQPDPRPGYLESVARLCQALDIQPIILVVAKSEHEAHQRQSLTEEICNSFRLVADFDLVVGCDPPAAVERVASWRSCSHLIVERPSATSWWRHARDTGLEPFRGLADSLSLLALPSARVLDVPHKIRHERARQPGTDRRWLQNTLQPETLPRGVP